MSAYNMDGLKTLEQYAKLAKLLKLMKTNQYNKFKRIFNREKRVQKNTLNNLIEQVKDKLDNHFYFQNILSNLGNIAVEKKQKEKKRILEFSLDLFIPEADSGFKTKQDSKVYTIDGIRYKRLNNSKFRFTGDVKYYPDIRKYGLVWLNRNHYEPFIKLLNKINPDKTNEFLTILMNLSVSKEISFVEIFDIRVVVENTVPLNFEDVEVFHDSKAIDFKYISYDIDLDKNSNNWLRRLYKTDYVNYNFVSESCFLSVLLDVFKDSIQTYWNRYNKKRYLTYESLYKMIYPERVFKPSGNGMSFSRVVEGFFKPMRIEAYLFDITYNIQSYHKPEKPSSHYNSVIYLLYHNGHMYHLDANIKRLEQIRDRYFRAKEDDIIAIPSVSYTIIHKDCTKIYLMIENIQGLIDIIKDDTLDGEIEILYQEDITDLYFDLYFHKETNYTATPYMKDSNSILSFRLNNIGNKQISVFHYSEEGVSENQVFDDAESLKNYEMKKLEVMKTLLTRNYISTYSENVQNMFCNNVIGGVIGDFEEEGFEGERCYKFDFNRYYTSILQTIDKFPVINSFDEFVKYEGEDIQDLNLYYVKKIGNKISYPMKRYNLCYGMNIKGVQDVEIISVLNVSKLKVNKSNVLIEAIYNDESLTNQQKKDMFNTLIGKYDKKENKNYVCNISEDEYEINSFLKMYGGEKYSVVSGEKILYFNVLNKNRYLNEGFKPISLLIKDIANKKLFQLKDELQSVGIRVLGCNTDCIYFEKNDKKVEQFKRNFSHYFDFEDKNSYQAIGKLKFEDVVKSGSKLLEVKENEDSYIECIEPIVQTIELKDEFDLEEIREVVESNDRLIIKADIAGAGKTTSFLNRSNTLIICPYNALCFDLNNRGEEAITLNKLIGLRYDGEKNVDVKGYDISDIERIVFDEIYLYPTTLLEKINKFMNTHRDIKYYATGDEYQLEPIEKLNIEETREYYNKIILSMFPNQIVLHENKRCKTDEDRKRMKEITKSIREASSKEEAVDIVLKHFKKIYRKEDIVTTKNVCALNKTSDWVNEYLHKYDGENKYYVGLELIGRKTFKNKKCNIKINYTYTIKKVLEEALVLYDGEEEHVVDNKDIEKIFKLNYSRTCHSLQGMSINEGITIFDVFNPFVSISWIYTAITRATSLDLIHIYCVKENTIDFLKLDEAIRSRIQGHMQYDITRFKRIDTDYINIKFVKELLFATKKCKFCERRFDLNDSESWSIDRIDNHISHTKDNCQIICRRCNNGKK